MGFTMTNNNNTAPMPSPEYLRFATAISNAIAANRELMKEFNPDEPGFECLASHDEFLDSLFDSVAEPSDFVHVSVYVDEFKKEIGLD